MNNRWRQQIKAHIRQFPNHFPMIHHHQIDWMDMNEINGIYGEYSKDGYLTGYRLLINRDMSSMEPEYKTYITFNANCSKALPNKWMTNAILPIINTDLKDNRIYIEISPIGLLNDKKWVKTLYECNQMSITFADRWWYLYE